MMRQVGQISVGVDTIGPNPMLSWLRFGSVYSMLWMTWLRTHPFKRTLMWLDFDRLVSGRQLREGSSWILPIRTRS